MALQWTSMRWADLNLAIDLTPLPSLPPAKSAQSRRRQELYFRYSTRTTCLCLRMREYLRGSHLWLVECVRSGGGLSGWFKWNWKDANRSDYWLSAILTLLGYNQVKHGIYCEKNSCQCIGWVEPERAETWKGCICSCSLHSMVILCSELRTFCYND